MLFPKPVNLLKARNLMAYNRIDRGTRARGGMRRFNGAPGGAAQSTGQVKEVVAPAPEVANTINIGRRSRFNVETPLHNNAIVVKLTNNNSTHKADLVLTAGRFADDADYSAQVITDGDQDTVNDAGTTVNVSVECEYGVDGTKGTYARFLEYIKEEGFAIASTKLEWTLAAQKMHKLRFKYANFFGDHTLDHLFPQVNYDPNQYHDKQVQFDVAFPLDKNTILKYSLQPDETVLLTFWVAGIHEQQRIITDFARQLGGNSLG